MDRLTDHQLAGQPAAYWTGVAYEALIAFTRAEHLKQGFTQSQFWLLRNLSLSDISADGRGMTVAELQRAMSDYLRPEDDLATEARTLVDRGWLRLDGDGRYWITEDGEEARLRLKEHAPAIRGLIHEGIDDGDYVIALNVLRRMIENVTRAT